MFLCTGKFSKKFEGNESGLSFPEKWKTGDDIIIKRDSDNDLWFGLNDEQSVVKSCNAEGSFRIVMGFLNGDKSSEEFKLTYLQAV